MRPTRLLTGLVSIALVAVALVALLPDCASACTCAREPGIPEQERAERALDRATVVFAGEVVDVSGGEPATVSFRVSEVWKGPSPETLEVTTSSQASACGYPFSEGRKYLVYADGKKMGVSGCGRTTPLSEASADLEVLGDGETLGGSGAVLYDTSGGFPPLGVIGMVGAAVAVVSLAMLMRLVRTS